VADKPWQLIAMGVGVAVVSWVLLACGMLLPQPEHRRDVLGAFTAAGVAVVGALVLWGVVFAVALWMGWTTW
jgi:hypothetical protein